MDVRAVDPSSQHGFKTIDLDQPRPMFIGVGVTIAPDHACVTGLHAMAGAADPGCHPVATAGDPYGTHGIATIDLRNNGHVPPTIVGKRQARRSPSRVARRRESHRGRPGHSRRVARAASRGGDSGDSDEGEPARGRLTLAPPLGGIYSYGIDGRTGAIA